MEILRAMTFVMLSIAIFFVEKFYETDFKKASPRAPMGSRVFDLTEVMGTDQLPDIEQLAEDLKDKSWT